MFIWINWNQRTSCIRDPRNSTTRACLAGDIDYTSAFLFLHDRKNLSHELNGCSEVDCHTTFPHIICEGVHTTAMVYDACNIDKNIDTPENIQTSLCNVRRSRRTGQIALEEFEAGVVFKRRRPRGDIHRQHPSSFFERSLRGGQANAGCTSSDDNDLKTIRSVPARLPVMCKMVHLFLKNPHGSTNLMPLVPVDNFSQAICSAERPRRGEEEDAITLARKLHPMLFSRDDRFPSCPEFSTMNELNQVPFGTP